MIRVILYSCLGLMRELADGVKLWRRRTRCLVRVEGRFAAEDFSVRFRLLASQFGGCTVWMVSFVTVACLLLLMMRLMRRLKCSARLLVLITSGGAPGDGAPTSRYNPLIDGLDGIAWRDVRDY